jgi:DNA-directed RNA polymerase alpha subunit
LAESVDKLELGPDAAAVAQSLKAAKVGDLARLSDMELYLAAGSGQTVVQEIATALGAHGLNLKRPPII